MPKLPARNGSPRSYPIEYIHRDNREGFKAGALAAGLKTARGEFVAIFDADFVPPRDILQNVVNYFTDDKVGMVQVRWDHLNRDASLLTQSPGDFPRQSLHHPADRPQPQRIVFMRLQWHGRRLAPHNHR